MSNAHHRVTGFRRLIVAGAGILTAQADVVRRTVSLPHPYRVQMTTQRSSAKVWEHLLGLRKQPTYTFHVATYNADGPGDYIVSMTAETFVSLLGAHYKNEVQPRERQGEHAS